MSELIYPNEVEPELDTEGHFYQYVVASLLPRESGTNITNLVSGETVAVDGGNIVFNGDSVTGASTTDGDNDAIFSIVDPRLDAYKSGEDDLLFIFDYKLNSPPSWAYHPLLSTYNSTDVRDYLNVRVSHADGSGTGGIDCYGMRSNSGLDAGKFIENNYQRTVYAVHLRGSDNISDLYRDGVLYSSTAISASITNAKQKLSLGVGSPNDKFYSSHLLVKEGSFSSEEIDYLVTNPYQLFKSSFDTEQEYALFMSGGDGNPHHITFDSVSLESGDTLECTISNMDGSLGDNGYIVDSAGTRPYIIIKNDNVINFNTAVMALEINGITAIANVTVVPTDGGTIVLKASITSSCTVDKAFCRTNDVDGLKAAAHSLRITSAITTNSRFWEFNQATNTPFVKDHYNGAIAELINFDAYSGYVRKWGMSEGLEFNSSESQYVTISIDHPPSLNWELTFVLDLIEAVGGWYRLASDGTGAQRLLIKEDLTELRHYRNSNEFNFTGLSLSLTDVLTLKAVNGTKLELLINGVSAGFSNNTQTYTGISYTFFGRDSNGYGSFNVRSLSFLTDTAEYNRYYDFTKIKGSSLTVPEILNGKDGTMVGYPANGVFVPEKTKDLIGQKFDGNKRVDFSKYAQLTGVFTTEIKCTLGEAGNNRYIYWRSGYSLANNGLQLGWLNATTIRWGTESKFIDILASSLAVNPVNGVAVYTSISDGTEIELFQGTVSLGSITATLVNNSAGKLHLGSRAGGNYSLGTISYYREDLGSTGVDDIHLDFTQEAGNTILDNSGNANHGTVIGGELQRIYGNYSGFGEMAGYKFNGVVKANCPPVNRTETKWRIEFRYANPNLTTNVGNKIFEHPTTTNDNIEVKWQTVHDYVKVRIDAVDYVMHGGSTPPVTNDQLMHDYVIECDGTNLTSYIDGELLETIVGAPLFKDLSKFSSSGTFAYFKYYETDGGDNLVYNWDFTTGEMSARIGGTWEPHVVEAKGNHGKLVGGVTVDSTGATFGGVDGKIVPNTMLSFISGDTITFTISGFVSGGATQYICDRNTGNGTLRAYALIDASNNIVFNDQCISNVTIDGSNATSGSTSMPTGGGEHVIVLTFGGSAEIDRFGTRYSDASYANFIMSSVVATGSNPVNYDFTKTIDIQNGGTVQPVIKETIQGKHAIISGDSTTGFQPIVPVNVFTVGAGLDYTYLNEGIDANEANTSHVKFNIYEDHVMSGKATPNNLSNYPNGYTIEGMKNPFNGDFTTQETVRLSLVGQSYLIYDKTTRMNLKNLLFSLETSQYIQYNLADSGYTMSGCGVKTTDSTAISIGGTGKYLHTNSYFYDDGTGSNYLTLVQKEGLTASFTNCIFVGTYSDNYMMLRVRFGDVTYHNCIAYNKGTGDIFGVVLNEKDIYGSNNISSDSTASDEGIGTQADMTGWFTT